jgi:hypothetical protein
MRGHATSITCPRCGLEAPPSDSVMPFTTCSKCGLSFDASPKERAVRPRRPVAPDQTEPAPERPRPMKRPGLRGWQILGVLGVLLISGTIKYELSWGTRGTRAQLEEIEREERETSAAHRRALEELKEDTAALKTGVASCDALLAIIRTRPSCPTSEATRAVGQAVDATMTALASDGTGSSAEAMCTQAMASVDAVRVRVGCR